MKIKVLFVCIHNTVVVDSMKEIGIDISGNKTKSVFEYYKQGRRSESKIEK